MRKGRFLAFIFASTLVIITSFIINTAYVAAEENGILNSGNVGEVCNFYWTSSAEAHNTIDCRNKGIKKIESNTFSEFSSRDIREIRLSDNEIETIEDGSFNGMESLFYLYLDNNEIDSLRPGMLDSLSNLVELEINNNKIRNIYDGTFGTLNKLSKLSLNNNEMTSLNPGVFRGLNNLYRLNITNNQISNIGSNTFAGLSILQSINLSSNKIESIDAYTFAGLNNAYINLKQNCLREVPEIPGNNNIVADDQLACASNGSVDAGNTANSGSNTQLDDQSLQDILSNGYTREMNIAYEFAYANGITTMKSIDQANMNGSLTRIAMAKMLSQYAINILKQTPDTSKQCSFSDVTMKMDSNYNNGVTLACQLGIMGVGITNFRPNDNVTRAEFGTALSRMLFGLADGNKHYYTTHLAKLKSEGIIVNDDPTLKELRGYVMLMLMRSAK